MTSNFPVFLPQEFIENFKSFGHGSGMPNHRDLYPSGLATSQSVALLFSRVLAAPGAWDVQHWRAMNDSPSCVSWLSFKSWCHTQSVGTSHQPSDPMRKISSSTAKQIRQPSAHLHKCSSLANQAWLLAPQSLCRPLAMP